MIRRAIYFATAEPPVGGGAPPAAAPSPNPAATPPPPPPEGDDFAALSASFKKADEAPKVTKGKEPPPPKADAPPKADDKPLPEKPGQGDWKAFRENYNKMKADLELTSKGKAELETKLQKQIADYEARGKDTSALTERLDNLQKEMDRIQAENRALKQETDPKFKEQWDKPFEREAARAERDMQGINILKEVVDAEGNKSLEVVREATYKDDFVRLFRMNRAEALITARKLFGDQAEIVTDHLKALWRMDDERAAALHEQREQWKTKQAEDDANEVKRKEHISRTQERVRKELGDAVEEYHDPADDKELNDARAQGYAIFDAAPKSLDQAIIKHEHVRHRVAAYEPHRIQIARLKHRIAELEAAQKEKEEPTPGPTKKPGGSPAPIDANEDFESGLRKHMAAAGQL